MIYFEVMVMEYEKLIKMNEKLLKKEIINFAKENNIAMDRNFNNVMTEQYFIEFVSSFFQKHISSEFLKELNEAFNKYNLNNIFKVESYELEFRSKSWDTWPQFGIFLYLYFFENISIGYFRARSVFVGEFYTYDDALDFLEDSGIDEEVVKEVRDYINDLLDIVKKYFDVVDILISDFYHTLDKVKEEVKL